MSNSKSELSAAEVQHVAKLARLDLTDSELELLREHHDVRDAAELRDQARARLAEVDPADARRMGQRHVTDAHRRIFAQHAKAAVDLVAALDATPTGLEGKKFPRDGRPNKPAPKAVPPQRCSAFIATG